MEAYIEILERFIEVCDKKVCDEDLFTEISIKCDGLTREAIENLLTKYKELEEEKARYECKYEIVFNKLIEYEKTLEKLKEE